MLVVVGVAISDTTRQPETTRHGPKINGFGLRFLTRQPESLTGRVRVNPSG